MKGQENKWPSGFSTITKLDARRQWNSAFRVLKGNNFYLELESLINGRAWEWKLRHFSDTQERSQQIYLPCTFSQEATREWAPQNEAVNQARGNHGIQEAGDPAQARGAGISPDGVKKKSQDNRWAAGLRSH